MLTGVDAPEAVSVAEAAKGQVTTVEPSRGERAIVRRVSEARATVPDVELGAVVDVSAWPPATSFPTAALVRASALALRAFPRANGSYRDGRFELYSRVNVAVVMPAADGYLAPTVFDADRKSAAEIDPELSELTRRALAGELTSPELAGATFTVTNLGGHRIARVTPILNPPQAAALAVGAVRAVPVVREDGLVAGRQLELALACDHRILYGEMAAAFLERLVSSIESSDPATL
jgi:pyruvate dehydrogenase E2 component (dihydrolipoamide acetyltransferase)